MTSGSGSILKTEWFDRPHLRDVWEVAGSTSRWKDLDLVFEDRVSIVLIMLTPRNEFGVATSLCPLAPTPERKQSGKTPIFVSAPEAIQSCEADNLFAQHTHLRAAAPDGTRVSFGSWLCENAEAGSLTGLDCSATELREVCENIFPISSPTQPDAAPSIVRPRGPARKAKSGRITP